MAAVRGKQIEPGLTPVNYTPTSTTLDGDLAPTSGKTITLTSFAITIQRKTSDTGKYSWCLVDTFTSATETKTVTITAWDAGTKA